MNAFWIIAVTEWKRFWRNRIGRLAVLASIFIPLLYSGLYLYAFWNPYGKLGQLPAAIVNLDKGSDGIHAGDRLKDQLISKKTLDWHVTSLKEAKSGLDNKRYYFMLTIPPSYSRDLASLATSSAHPAKLIFTYNEGKNYLASLSLKRVEASIREEVGNAVTQVFLRGLFQKMDQARKDLRKAATGARRLANGTSQLAAGSVRLQNAVHRLVTGAHRLQRGTHQLRQGTEEMAGELNRIRQKLLPLIAQIQAKQKLFARLQEQLNLELSGNIKGQPLQLHPFLKRSLDVLAELLHRERKFVEGTIRLRQGIKQVDEGAEQLSAGLDRLDQEIIKLRAATNQLNQGAQTLASRLQRAAEVKLPLAPDKWARLLSNPIQDEAVRLHPVKQYGAGLAPYFLPLSLWVGAIVLYFVLPLGEARWRIGPHPPFTIALGKFTALVPFGALQGLVAGLFIQFALGLKPVNPPTYYLFLVLVAWMSIAIVGFLIATFKDPGRLIAIILLILQLVSSGGTYPLEMIPSPLHLVHPFVPMSYGVEGLRAILFTGQTSVIWHTAFILFLFLSVPLALWAGTQRKLFALRELRTKDHLGE